MTLKQLIENKKFDYVNSDIESHFELEKVRSDDFKLFHFGRYISSEDAIKEMEKAGYVPANLTELLLWEKWNEEDWVVALGSVALVLGVRYVPYLDGRDSERNLNLHWFGDVWYGFCRFLGTKVSSETKSSALGNSYTLNLEARVEALEESMKKIKQFLII